MNAPQGQQGPTASTQQQNVVASSSRSPLKSRLSVCTASLEQASAVANDASTWGTASRPSSAAPAIATVADVSPQLKTSLTAAEMLEVGRIQPAAAAGTKAPLSDRLEEVASPHANCDTVTAADEAVQDNFSKLLTGKMTRTRAGSVVNSPTAAAAGLTADQLASAVADAAAATVSAAPSSATAAAAGPRSSVLGTPGRLSLAHIGLLAAPSAGLLPGSCIEASSPVAAASDQVAAGKAAAGRKGVYQQYTPGAAGPAAAAAAAARHSTAPLDPRAVAMKQMILELQQQASNSSPASVAAGHKPPQPHDSPRSATSSADTDVSSSPQGGSAAFKTTSRQQAGRVGRVHIEADSPGPAHYRPTQDAMQKHVPSMHIAGHSSNSSSRSPSPSRAVAAAESPAAAHESAQQPQQTAAINARTSVGDFQELRRTSVANAILQAPGVNTGVLALQAATAAAAAAAARASATGFTPRLDDPGQAGPLGLKGHRVHARQRAAKGSSSFMTVSREQRERQGRFGRPTSAAAEAGCSNAATNASSNGGKAAISSAADSLTDGGHDMRPRSSKGVPFIKQTARPASPAGAGNSSPTLGPGSYHRTGQLPISYTGGDVAAGHPGSSLERSPDFNKYSMRPGTSPAAIGGSRGSGGNVQPGPAGDWPGLWGWAAAAEGCVHQYSQPAAHSDTGQQQEGPQMQRPSSSVALSYARTQLGADLIAEQQQVSADPGLATQGTIDLLQRQQQQKRPVSIAGHHQQRLKSASRVRPASAGPVLGGTAAARASSLLEAYGYPVAGLRTDAASPKSSITKGGVLGLQELQKFSSTGLAPRVKGGAFSTGSRAAASKVLRAMSVGSVIPPAAVAVLQPGTELSYEPNPEVQGHMHRSPGWSLPPNRLATSRKWAQLAQQAALQP